MNRRGTRSCTGPAPVEGVFLLVFCVVVFFWASCGCDWCVLVEGEAVLGGEGCGGCEFLFADVAVSGEC